MQRLVGLMTDVFGKIDVFQVGIVSLYSYGGGPSGQQLMGEFKLDITQHHIQHLYR